MLKLPKAIIKKYGITKKAWQVFRAQRGGKKAGKKTKSAKAESEAPMAKKKKKSGGGKAHRVAKKVGAAMQSRPGKMVMYAVEAAAGGVVTSLVVNKAPVIKDQGRGVKSLVQGGLGLAAVFFVRNAHVKSMGAGAVIASVMGLAREYLKVEPLAGPSAGSARLSPSEMQRLVSGQMGMPLPGQTMGVPIGTAPGNAGFNRRGFGS